MSVKLDGLLKREVEDFYELFFGKILIKKPGFSYYSNLVKFLSKDDSITNVLNRLNDTEKEILKTLSSHDILIPYRFISEKLNIILNIPIVEIRKAVNNLFDKKYIFIRDEKQIVIPGVYFEKMNEKINYRIAKIEKDETFFSKAQIDINNILNYFISKEIKISNYLSLYKKDIISIKDIFSKYSGFNEKDFNLIGYFYSRSFLDEENNLIIKKVEEYFKLSHLQRAYFFIKIVFPWVFSIFKFIEKEKQSLRFELNDFKKLWEKSILISNNTLEPFKLDFSGTLKFLEHLELLETNKNTVIAHYYKEEEIIKNDNMKLNSSFNIYVNAESMNERLFFTALFADIKKYNKLVEYEINENSIKRSILNGLDFDKILDHLKNNNMKISKNVETTVKQWFDKQASFFFTHGTVFFASSKDKGKLISKIAQKGLIKVFEIKENEVFLIPEENKKSFFDFLNKSGINYYSKQPKAANLDYEINISDISKYLNKKKENQ